MRPCSPADPAKCLWQNIFLFHSPWSRPLGPIPSGSRGWSRARGVPCCDPCSPGLLMSEFLEHTRGAGWVRELLTLAVNEYFQNRAPTFLRECVLTALLRAQLCWASLTLFIKSRVCFKSGIYFKSRVCFKSRVSFEPDDSRDVRFLHLPVAPLLFAFISGV